MAIRPVVGSAAEELYGALGPWAEEDTASARFELLTFCEAIMGRLQPVEDVARDSDAGPGWSSIMDVNRAPAAYLDWLAQFAGVRMTPGLLEEGKRSRIRSTDGFRRGSPAAIRAAPAPFLTGNKVVFVTERQGSAYRFAVATIDTETPNPAAVERALRDQKPAGLIMTYSVITQGTYLQLRDTHASYGVLKTVYPQYTDVLANPAKQ